MGVLKVWMKCEVAPIFFFCEIWCSWSFERLTCMCQSNGCVSTSFPFAFFFPLAIYLDVDAQQQNE